MPNKAEVELIVDALFAGGRSPMEHFGIDRGQIEELERLEPSVVVKKPSSGISSEFTKALSHTQKMHAEILNKLADK